MNFEWENIFDDFQVPGAVLKKIEELDNKVKTLDLTNNTHDKLTKLKTAGLHSVQKNINKYNRAVKDYYNVRDGDTIVLNGNDNQLIAKSISESILCSENGSDKNINKIINKYDELCKSENVVVSMSKTVEEDRKRKLTYMARIYLKQRIAENTRKKKIKSKNYHKKNYKDKSDEFVKAFEQLDMEDPEAVKKIQDELETKRAESRLLQEKKMRNKWARLAKRFGGKEIERVINEQYNIAKEKKDEIEAFKKILEEQKNQITDEDSSDDENEIKQRNSKLWNMPFIKKAKQNLTNFSSDILMNDDSHRRIQQFLENKFARLDQKTDLINKEPLIDDSNQKAKLQDEKVQQFLDRKIFLESSKNSKFFKLDNDNTPETIEIDINQDQGKNIDEIENSRLIDLAFNLTENKEELDFEEQIINKESEIIKNELDNVIPEFLDGWGAWAADNYVNKKALARNTQRNELLDLKKKQLKSESAHRSRVQIHNDACNVPEKYKVAKTGKISKIELFKLNLPISSDFVPYNISKKFTTPKYQTNAGQVINSLQFINEE